MAALADYVDAAIMLSFQRRFDETCVCAASMSLRGQMRRF
jgi:hypothetical protein